MRAVLAVRNISTEPFCERRKLKFRSPDWGRAGGERHRG